MNPFAIRTTSSVTFHSGAEALAAIKAVMDEVEAAKAKISYAALAKAAGVFPRGMGKYLDQLPLAQQALVVGGDGLPAGGFWRKLEAKLGPRFAERGPKIVTIVSALPYWGAGETKASSPEEALAEVDAFLAKGVTTE